MMSATYDPVTFISVLVGEERRPATFKGRFAWMLHELVKAGKDGLTTLENPAPRISHYVYILRKAGLTISMQEERHAGAFKGHHGRYRLETPVMIQDVRRFSQKRMPEAKRRA